MNELVRRLPPAAGLNDQDYTNLEAHPLAKLLPMIEGAEFANLKADIAKHGLQVKMKLYGGRDDGTVGPLRLLDGRNRHKALKENGHKFSVADFEIFEGTYAEAEAYVLSTNFQRRHLSKTQQREVIKSLIERYKGYSNRQIARICGVSHVTVGDVKEKMENPPELAKFKAWKNTWDELPDDQRMAFVKEYEADIREMLEA
jgi:hypothetical protein